MRTAARRDDNEPDIIKALELVGCTVRQLSQRDIPDLLCWSPHLNAVVLMEVKAPGKALREGQEKFFESWPGRAELVTDVAEALDAAGVGR